MNKRTGLLGLVLAGAVAATFATAGAAQAATGTATLVIGQKRGSDYLVTVSGQAPGGVKSTFGVNLYGEDKFFEDYVFGGFDGTRGTTDDQGRFSISFWTPKSLLNEDWGEDEVFAKVTTFSQSQRTKVTRSNTIHRSF